MTTARPRIVLIGTGAMGGLFAAALHDAGADLTVVDRDPAIVTAIRRDGLRVRRHGTDAVCRVQAEKAELAGSTQPAGATAARAPADFVMIFTKGYDTDAALTAAAPWTGMGTVFVTLQNGLGNVERIRARHPPQTIVYGLTTLTAEVLAPGTVEAKSAGPGETRFWTTGGEQPAARAFASLLSAGGIAADVDPAIDVAIWRKLIINCGFNPLCAVVDASVGDVAGRPAAWPVLDGVAAEIVDVAAARGVMLDLAGARQHLRHVAQEAARHYPSMVADFRAGRAGEIDNLNGAVLAAADAAGIAAPYCRSLDAMVRIREFRLGVRP